MEKPTKGTESKGSAPQLSLIIPAHNEELRLPSSLEQIIRWMQKCFYEVEIVLVENGSQDRTLEIAESYADRFPNIYVYQSAKGKGAAVYEGVMRSCGEYLFICDADLSMPITEVTKFLPPYFTNCDIVIASREGDGAVRYNEPPYRHFMGRIFNFLVRTLLIPGFADTQCGFKLFRRQPALELFALQTITGWTFDVEILYLALKRDYRVAEVPIHWYFDADSRVRPLVTTWQMLRDLVRIRFNDLQGRYDQCPCTHVTQQETVMSLGKSIEDLAEG